jgi:methionyl-tRNA formyltransferase
MVNVHYSPLPQYRGLPNDGSDLRPGARAGRPYPPAHTYLGPTRIGIIRAAPVRDAPRYVGRIPGRVVSASRQDGYADVLTGDGLMRIHEVSVGDEGRVQPAAQIIASLRHTLGLRAEDLVARIAELEEKLERLQPAGAAPHGFG